MQDFLSSSPSEWSYGIAALVFVAFCARLLLSWRGGRLSYAMLAATSASALWAIFALMALKYQGAELWWSARFFDVIRIASWMVFMSFLLRDWLRDTFKLGKFKLTLPVTITIVLLFIAAIALPEPPPSASKPQGSVNYSIFLVLLAISVLGLVLAEQLYRRTPLQNKWAIKPLVIGLSGMFAFDLLMYAEAVLFGNLNVEMWAARGIAHAFLVIFFAIATARNTEWTIDLHVSRDLVFHSTAILVAGIAMLVIAGAGYWVRVFGGGWGETLQIAFVFAALLFLLTVALSGSIRARFRVFIGKNFFSYRYDYRKEWLLFTEALDSVMPNESLNERVIRAIAKLVESTGGALWLRQDDEYRQVAQINLPEINELEPVSSQFSILLNETRWVIDITNTQELLARFPKYLKPVWLDSSPQYWLVLPLFSMDESVGFVILTKPLAAIDINWEVRDLLKTAGRQAASQLALFRASESLLEAEKFDAFHRMSAFIVHDLKNLIAQLALLLKNAERHRDNAEFQQDMLETIQHVVTRMNQLTLQLKTGAAPLAMPRPVDILELIEKVVQAKHQSRALIEIESGSAMRVLAHEEQLERVIGHIIQNAIEATAANKGQIMVRTLSEAGFVILEVSDRGTGMSKEFIRDRLFKPFQTTKPTGMGIGTNECFQYVNAIGGRVEVESELDCGTRFRIYLRTANEITLAAL